MRERQFGILRIFANRFAVLSLVCVAALALSLGFALSWLFERAVSQWEWENTAAYAQHEVNLLNLDSLFQAPAGPETAQRWRQEAARLFEGLPEVVRIKVWSRQATVLWSDEERLIGRHFPDNRTLAVALTGRVSVAIKPLTGGEHAYDPQGQQIAEVYVPIFSETTKALVGVIEIYKKPTRLLATIRHARMVIWSISLVGAFGLYLLLWPLVRDVYGRQVREELLRAHAGGLEAEVAQRRRVEEDYRSVNRALRVLSEGNHALVRATDEATFLSAICHILVDVGGYRMGWVGLAQDDAQKSVRPVAQAGFEAGYLERAQITWAETERGSGPTGTAIRSGRPSINKLDDPTFEPWRAEALKRGYAANLALPLLRDGKAFGALGIYAAEASAFDAEEVSLFMRMADNVAYGIHALRDRAARARLEGELRQAQKMEAVGRLAGGIAHDFNNIMTVIFGRAEMVLDDFGPEHPSRAGIELIRDTAERASGLTRQLLAFSRKQILQPKRLDLNDHVAAGISMLRQLIGENIELDFRPGDSLGRVVVDPAQLQQVLVNLALNARDSMPGGGRLTLQTMNVNLDASDLRQTGRLAPGPYVMLAISDTGIGIDPAVQPRIFEPFFTTKAPGQGTGLGLATVYGIITQSGGDITVCSEPGCGTTFQIYLPRIEEVVPEVVERIARGDANGGAGTVLIVEDQAAVADITREMLVRAGYEVLVAGDPLRALEISAGYQGPIQLLLTDVVMPRMNGERLQQAIRAQRPDIAVLYMSGYTDDALACHGVLRPGVHLLEKPFTREGLLEKVRETLESVSGVVA